MKSMAAYHSHAHRQRLSPNPGQSQSQRNLYPFDDPLLESPLYFQGLTVSSNIRSTGTVKPISPTSSFGRPMFNHSHWAPPGEKSYSRSLPPPERTQYRSNHYQYNDQESPQSSLKKISPRRRSLPPVNGSPERKQNSYLQPRSPPLWSVSEDDFIHDHEPMDISPVRPVRSPTKVTRVSSVPFGSFPSDNKSSGTQLIFPNHKYSSTPKIRDIKKRGTTPPGIRKLREKEDNLLNLIPKPEAEERNIKPDQGSSFCGYFCCCIMVVIPVLIGAAAVVTAYFSSDVLQLWCQHGHSLNTTLLKESFGKYIYGQHIAVDVVPKALERYMENYPEDNQMKKPLVMSFHGWTGVGKSYMSFILGEHLRRGVTNKIICSHHFPHLNQDYRAEVRNMIIPKLTRCYLNLFVIDDMDKATPSVIQSLHDIFREMKSAKFAQDSGDFNVIFVLLSNTGGALINSEVYNALYHEKRKRESLTLEEMESVLLSKENLESEKFAWFNKLHQAGLIDVVVPFLPMEKEHVRMCIRKDMQNKGIEPTEDSVEQVLAQMAFFPQVELFSVSGCRKVPAKVDIDGN